MCRGRGVSSRSTRLEAPAAASLTRCCRGAVRALRLIQVLCCHPLLGRDRCSARSTLRGAARRGGKGTDVLYTRPVFPGSHDHQDIGVSCDVFGKRGTRRARLSHLRASRFPPVATRVLYWTCVSLLHACAVMRNHAEACV